MTRTHENAEVPPRTTKGRPRGRPFVLIKRRRPTLPGPRGPSTIGAEGLNFSVRNGKRCFPLAIATERLRDRPLPGPQNRTAEPISPRSAHKGRLRGRQELGKNIRQALEQLVPVG